MNELVVDESNLGDVGASYLMKCVSKVKELHARECGISPKMKMKLKEQARLEGCVLCCE